MSQIKQLAETDRPREKMHQRGEEALTTAELLAILIGSGTKSKSAVELMEEIMSDCDRKLVLLSRMSIEELMRYNGIGEAKAITLKAAMELGRRRASEDMASSLDQLRSAEQVYRYMLPVVRDLGHETSWALLFNNSMRLIKRVRISQGGRTGTLVDVRIVLKHALLNESTAIMLVHNHPSGSCHPSKEDNALTRHLDEACRTLSIRLIDHIVVTDGGYYSYAENGKL